MAEPCAKGRLHPGWDGAGRPLCAKELQEDEMVSARLQSEIPVTNKSLKGEQTDNFYLLPLMLIA